MTDRRFLASNGRVALSGLEDEVEAEHYRDGEPMQLTGNAWLCDSINGLRDRQLLWGDPFRVLEEHGGQAFGISEKDGYVGNVPVEALGARCEATHRIAVRTTWAYGAPDFKIAPGFDLHMNSPVRVLEEVPLWAEIETSNGAAYLPSNHIVPLGAEDADPVTAAHFLIGTPYVWAGNTGFGIDCSGLVQAAFHAAGRDCSPDSDLQEKMAGEQLDRDAPLKRGDLIFWRGHVGMMADGERIIHANAHHMAVAIEPLKVAIARIAETDTGDVTSRLRPD